MLIVHLKNFTVEDKIRLDKILSSLSEETHKYTMVVTTKNIEIGTSVDQDMENVLQEIITQCNNRHLDLSGCSQASLLGMIEELVKVNKGSLICELFEEAKPAVLQKPSEQTGGQLKQEDIEKPGEQTEKTGSRFYTSLKPTFERVKGFGKSIMNFTKSGKYSTPTANYSFFTGCKLI
ncbi:hypothetical protein C0J50_6592 [Silurus asotus]|uniref:Uncharacterized protein n=1 Tax=Silurus asotus TaxID=30991 RepID=A0AAD5FAC1_SILAS|nr:hypothetical protein C0J50_6592 [Silurus asotus]